MQSFLITVAAVAVLGRFYVAAIDDLFVPGIRSLSRDKRSLTRNTTCNSSGECCKIFYGPKCSDCVTLLTCADELINEQSCSSFNPGKPYCVDNACTDKAPSSECNITNKFTCTSQGFFPDPDNCEKYFYCLGNVTTGFESVPFDCPSTYVYDSPNSMCKKKSSASDCTVISCTNNINRYQVAPFDKSILVYCADTSKSKETFLFRCPDSVNMEWDLNTLRCKFVCKAEGRYPDVEDCTKYYDCVKNGTVLSYTLSACPTGFKYDANAKMCVLGQC